MDCYLRFPVSLRQAVSTASIVALASTLSGCGGGGSSTPVAPPGVVTQSVAVNTTFCGAGNTGSEQANLAPSALSTGIQLPSMAKCQAFLSFQGGTGASGIISAASSPTVPANAPAALPTLPGGAAATPILFETLSFPAGASVVVPFGDLTPSIALEVGSAGTCTSFFETLGGAPSNPAGTLQAWQPFGPAGLTTGFVTGFNSTTNLNAISLGSPTVATSYFLFFACS